MYPSRVHILFVFPQKNSWKITLIINHDNHESHGAIIVEILPHKNPNTNHVHIYLQKNKRGRNSRVRKRRLTITTRKSWSSALLSSFNFKVRLVLCLVISGVPSGLLARKAAYGPGVDWMSDSCGCWAEPKPGTDPPNPAGIQDKRGEEEPRKKERQFFWPSIPQSERSRALWTQQGRTAM